MLPISHHPRLYTNQLYLRSRGLTNFHDFWISSIRYVAERFLSPYYSFSVKYFTNWIIWYSDKHLHKDSLCHKRQYAILLSEMYNDHDHDHQSSSGHGADFANRIFFGNPANVFCFTKVYLSRLLPLSEFCYGKMILIYM